MVNKFVLQWHISEVCNLKCLHCYQEHHTPVQLEFDKLLFILDQYRDFLKKLGIKGHINLTGGEPLCSPHFFTLLEEFKKDKDLYSFSILTNGTLITPEMAKKHRVDNVWSDRFIPLGDKKEIELVMENGDLVPCRRMPIVVGNLLSENLYDLYQNSPTLRMLREDTTPEDCRGCEHESLCRGGLKCLTYALHGDLNHKDAGCTPKLYE